MQFNFEPGAALWGSIAFLVAAIGVIIAVPWFSYTWYKDSVRWHQRNVKSARKQLKDASRQNRGWAQRELDHYLANPPKKPSLKKRTFWTIVAMLVTYAIVAMTVYASTATPTRTVNVDAGYAFEAHYGVVSGHEYDDLQLEGFVGTSTEGSSLLGTGSTDTHPQIYLVIVYDYRGKDHSVAVALSDIDITERAGAEPTLQFEISDSYYNAWWAKIIRTYEGCEEVMRWLWRTCDQEFVSEELVVDDAPPLSELVADDRISISLVMSPEQHREVLAGR